MTVTQSTTGRTHSLPLIEDKHSSTRTILKQLVGNVVKPTLSALAFMAVLATSLSIVG